MRSILVLIYAFNFSFNFLSYAQEEKETYLEKYKKTYIETETRSCILKLHSLTDQYSTINNIKSYKRKILTDLLNIKMILENFVLHEINNNKDLLSLHEKVENELQKVRNELTQNENKNKYNSYEVENFVIKTISKEFYSKRGNNQIFPMIINSYLSFYKNSAVNIHTINSFTIEKSHHSDHLIIEITTPLPDYAIIDKSVPHHTHLGFSTHFFYNKEAKTFESESFEYAANEDFFDSIPASSLNLLTDYLNANLSPECIEMIGNTNNHN